jgi:hypothetical protein
MLGPSHRSRSTLKAEARSLLCAKSSRVGRLFVIVLLVLGGSPSLASGRSAKRKGTPSSDVWFVGWDEGTPIFNKTTTWGAEGDEKEEIVRMRDGKLLPVHPKALSKPIESLPQGRTDDDSFPLQLVNLDRAKVEAIHNVILKGDGSWPKVKPVKARLEIHFKGKSGKDQILWRGTRTVRVYGDEGGPTVTPPGFRQASISPDGKRVAINLETNDTSEPLLLRLDDQ